MDESLPSIPLWFRFLFTSKFQCIVVFWLQDHPLSRSISDSLRMTSLTDSNNFEEKTKSSSKYCRWLTYYTLKGPDTRIRIF